MSPETARQMAAGIRVGRAESYLRALVRGEINVVEADAYLAEVYGAVVARPAARPAPAVVSRPELAPAPVRALPSRPVAVPRPVPAEAVDETRSVSRARPAVLQVGLEYESERDSDEAAADPARAAECDGYALGRGAA